MEAAATIEGVLEKVVYRNDENGYTVARVRESGNAEQTTVVGALPGICEGENLQIHGHWKSHPRYGRQFEVESCRVVPPSTLKGIVRYLSSGLIKGVGPKTAERIVKHFGPETLKVIEQEPGRLREIKGLGQKKVKQIAESFFEHRALQEAMVFLRSYGITTSQAFRIHEEYGAQAIPVIRANPYQLARDIFGIGFRTADKVAQNLGIPRDARARIDTGLLYTLTQLAEDGHVCVPRARLLEEARRVLEVDLVLAEAALARQLAAREIVLEPGGDDELVYLSRYHFSETRVAQRLLQILAEPPCLPRIHAERAIEWFEEKERLALADGQRDAIRSALQHKASVITGGPGVGKTTVVNAILKILQAKGVSVALAAPTGRAAKRLTESTGEPAQTLHRLLRFSPSTHRFEANEREPLKGDVFIVDECSMIDITLMSHLLRALPPQSHLVLVGDADQLPSVGPGNVLGDIIASGQAPVTLLDVIFRQSSRSHIVDWAHTINAGRVPPIPKRSNDLSDLYFIEKEDPEEVLRLILTLCTERIPQRFHFDPVRDIQVLAPMHKGVLGVGNLNQELRAALNPRRNPARETPNGLQEGDKVMQIRNNYDKEVFNGDLGFVSTIDPVDSTVTIRFDDREVEYQFSGLNEVVPAYAISVHKSQGTEYPAVVLPLVTQHFVLLHRNLLYTAITRARKLVVLVGTQRALRIAVQQEMGRSRCTGLCDRLRNPGNWRAASP